jgi:DNA-binding transcriptional MerR regulator
MSKYQSKHIQALFNISGETVRTWATEFERYLSPSANPEKGRTRRFTESDMQVFSTINRMREEGAHFEDIHAALGTGYRDEIELLENDDEDFLEVIAKREYLALYQLVQELAKRIASIETGGSEALRNEIQELRKERDEMIGEKAVLQYRLQEAQKRLKEIEEDE